MKEAKDKITATVKKAYDDEIINIDEYQGMLPHEDKMPVPELFYCTFKVHTQHEQAKAPRTRCILSCSGTLTENNALYVEYKTKHVGQNHKSYFHDTPDFLRYNHEPNDE